LPAKLLADESFGHLRPVARVALSLVIAELRGIESSAPIRSSDWGAKIVPNQLCQQAPLSTFDGTLISDMSFGTLTAQVLTVSNLPMRSADNPTFSGTLHARHVTAPVLKSTAVK